MGRSIGYECDECGELWPHSTKYRRCPRCQVACRSCLGHDVLSPGHARSICKEIEFEREYRFLEEKRERLGHPSPEDIGREEAREFAALWRACVEDLEALESDA